MGIHLQCAGGTPELVARDVVCVARAGINRLGDVVALCRPSVHARGSIVWLATLGIARGVGGSYGDAIVGNCLVEVNVRVAFSLLAVEERCVCRHALHLFVPHRPGVLGSEQVSLHRLVGRELVRQYQYNCAILSGGVHRARVFCLGGLELAGKLYVHLVLGIVIGSFQGSAVVEDKIRKVSVVSVVALRDTMRHINDGCQGQTRIY